MPQNLAFDGRAWSSIRGRLGWVAWLLFFLLVRVRVDSDHSSRPDHLCVAAPAPPHVCPPHPCCAQLPYTGTEQAAEAAVSVMSYRGVPPAVMKPYSPVPTPLAPQPIINPFPSLVLTDSTRD